MEHSEEPAEALDYLLSLGGEGGIFQASTSALPEEEHQYREGREVEFSHSKREHSMYFICMSFFFTDHNSIFQRYTNL